MRCGFLRRPFLAALLAAVAAGPALQVPAQDSEPGLPAVIEQLRHSPKDLALLERLKRAVTRSTDAGEAARGMAIYCLAMAWLDRLDEASAAQRTLATKYPDSPCLEAVAWGEVSKPCSSCNGEGVKRNVPCERCNGTRRCTACRGKGKVEILSKRPLNCSACNGTGRCAVCGGKGRGDAKCTRCGGRGRVVAISRAFQLYRALLKPVEDATGP